MEMDGFFNVHWREPGCPVPSEETEARAEATMPPELREQTEEMATDPPATSDRPP